MGTMRGLLGFDERGRTSQLEMNMASTTVDMALRSLVPLQLPRR